MKQQSALLLLDGSFHTENIGVIVTLYVCGAGYRITQGGWSLSFRSPGSGSNVNSIFCIYEDRNLSHRPKCFWTCRLSCIWKQRMAHHITWSSAERTAPLSFTLTDNLNENREKEGKVHPSEMLSQSGALIHWKTQLDHRSSRDWHKCPWNIM